MKRRSETSSPLLPLLFCATLLAACRTTTPVPAARSALPLSVGAPLAVGTPLVPAPASLVAGTGPAFELTRRTVIAVDENPEAKAIAESLAALLRPATGFPVPVVAAGTDSAGSIRLSISAGRAALGEEGYELVAAATGLRITAYRAAGLFRGIQTLRQLLPADIEAHMGVARFIWPVPAMTIVDRPRFAWRGSMLDVARHFFTVDEVKQYIDILALYKLNVLHLHLSDDQGWRIEIKSRPALTGPAASTQVGGGPGGFYSQQDYKEIVRYAQARYITVVPEIDMPGHTNAALLAYPELSCGARPPEIYTRTEVGWSALCVDKEATYALVDDVVREIAAITPGQYFHVGGDEVKELTHEQYARFIERVQSIVHRHGKKMVGWEEITKARLAPTTLVQQWKSDSATAALRYKAKLILSPAKKVYLDMKYNTTTELGQAWAGFIELRDAYDWDPAAYLSGVAESDVIGVEAPIWSETLRNITAVEYMALPRLPAVAEIAWSPQAAREWEDFRVRLATHVPRWHFLGINYYRSPQLP